MLRTPVSRTNDESMTTTTYPLNQRALSTEDRLLRNRGLFLFLATTIIIAISQIFYYVGPYGLFQAITIPLVMLLLLYSGVWMRLDEMFLLLFLIISSRYVTGFADRELKEIVLLPLFFIVLAFRRKEIEQGALPRVFVIYALLGLYVFLRGLEFPDYTSLKPDHITGFQGRWWVVCSLAAFLVGFYFSCHVNLKHLALATFWFYFVALILSSLMLVAGVDEMPLFNLYSWMKLEGVNRLGILSVSGVMCILMLLAERKLIGTRSLRFAAFGLAFWGVVAGGGRASLLGLLFTIWIYFFFIKRRKTLIVALTLILGLVIGLSSISDVSELLPEKYRRVIDLGDTSLILPTLTSGLGADQLKSAPDSEAGGSSAWRLLMWALALDAIHEKPFFGSGILTQVSVDFGTKTDAITDDFIMSSGNLHNTFLSLAYVWGVPAMILFGILVWGAIKRSYVFTLQRKDPFYTFCFLYLCGQSVEAFMTDVHLMYSFMMILGFVYARFSKVQTDQHGLSYP